ncbi:MAG TPA: hypothetical protein VFY40_19355, partial [Blastocatellia bacterium]|nr:hypothetical protein [Blastocatellia bacterium]
FLISVHEAVDGFRSFRLILIRAETNHMSLVQTDPGSIHPRAILPDDTRNESIARRHAVFPFFHRKPMLANAEWMVELDTLCRAFVIDVFAKPAFFGF